MTYRPGLRTGPLLGWLLACLVGVTTGCRTTKSVSAVKAAAAAPASEDSSALLSDAEIEQRTRAHAAFAAGVLHQERDEPDAAYDQFTRAAENDPGNEPLATEVARHYLQKNQTAAALVVLQRTAAQPGASGVIKTLLAGTLRHVGKTNAAIAAYRDALRATPTLLGTYQEFAGLYLELKQPAQAEAVIRGSLQVDSDVPEYWANTADLFSWLAKADGATKTPAKNGLRTALGKATALNPEDPSLLLRLGRGYLELGDNEKAEALFQQAKDRLPKNPGVAASLAEVLIREGRLKEARESLELLSRTNPTSHYPWYFLGVVDLEEHREAEAARKFERAINLNPEFEPAYADLAVAQLNQNDAQAAVATLTRAHARFPNSYRLSYLTGLAQSHLGKFDDAYAAFQKAEELARDKEPEALDHRFYFQVGAMLERAGREDESVKYLEQSLKLKPDFDEALNHLGYMWAEKGKNLERAQAMIEQAVKAEPDNPAYLDSLGWVLFKLGRPAEALPWLEKAVKLLPEPDATVYDHLADVLVALGRKDDAREAWRKSLEVEKSEAEKETRGPEMSAPHEFRKHYSLAEARALLPSLRLWLAELRLLQRQMDRSGERTAELLAEGRDLGGERVNEPLRSMARVQELLAELSTRELQLKDLDRGLVDFPSLRGDREVFLCWEDGEDDIEFWHDLETGFAGRERLE